MSTTFCSIKLLAFLSSFKVYRTHSFLYSHDRAYKLSKALNLSPITFKKYLAEAEQQGLLTNAGNGHKQFISIPKALEILFPKLKHGKHIHWFKNFERKSDFKYYYEKIKWAFAKANYKQQEYNIEQNKAFTEGVNSKISKGFYRKTLKRFNTTSGDEILKRITNSKKDVVTGKYHLAKILKCASSTAGKLLKKWAEQKLFTRSIHNCFFKTPMTQYIFDILKAQGHKYAQPNKANCGFFLNLGSAITNIQ